MSKAEAAAVWMPINDLTPWADNPRDNAAAIPEVAKSIKRFGFASPIIARPIEGGGFEIIAGHTRHQAALSLGLDRVPVRVMDLDPTDAKLLALADNKVGEIATWSDGLGDILRELEADGIDLDGLGFGDDELGELLAPLPIEPDGTEDDVPEVEEGEPDSKPGEVYELGPHRLVCGDSMAVDWSGYGVEVVVSDPPYCSGGKQEAQRTQGSVGRRGNEKAIERDNLTTDALAVLLERVVRQISPSIAVYLCTDWRQLQTVRRSVEPLGYSYRGLLVWDKQSGGLGWPFMHGYELIFCGVRSWPKSSGGGGVSDLIRVPRTKNENHTTEKPVELMRRLIAATPGSVIADPFAGSGTTLIAAAMEKRSAVVCEFDREYCDVIRRRWTAWANKNGQDPGPGALE